MYTEIKRACIVLTAIGVLVAGCNPFSQQESAGNQEALLRFVYFSGN